MNSPDVKSLPPLRDVIAKHGLRARKSLGQNFLLDLNLTGRIARAAGPLDDVTVYEVGPGPGGLTRALLDNGAAAVVAIETDKRCLDALDELAAAYPGRLHVIGGDALAIDERALLHRFAAGRTKIVANLPYNIATPLILRWLSAEPWPPWWAGMVVMVQKEVAARLTAEPGTKAYGRLSIAGQWRCRVRRAFDVPPQAFSPQPKVTSSVVQFEPLDEPVSSADRKILEMVVAAAFNQRRKMLRTSLKAVHPDTLTWIEAAGVDPNARAEQLSIQDFCALARTLSPHAKQ